jgi:hypothetical protein
VKPYRTPCVPPEELPDVELVAARELHRRADRARKLVIVPFVLGGVALGSAAYLGVRELFFAAMGAHQPVVTGVLGMLPPLLGAFWAARNVGDAVVRRALPGWRSELAAAHGVSEEAMGEHARIAGA